MKKNFVWERFNHPEFKRLRNKFGLEKIVSTGKNEFEKQLLLKNWVFTTLPLGYNNTTEYESALEILEDKNNPGGFNCSWYVLTFLQCATALGWYTRKLGIDTDHAFGEEEMRHTIVDIWSSNFKKWYAIDPMFNVHFEKENVPLNTFEIRAGHLKKEKVKKIFGIFEEENLSEKVKDRHADPANYYWFFILLRNNFLKNPNVYDSKALLWVDKFNKGKIWNVGGKHKGEFRKHPMYKGAFIKTNNFDLCFPKMR